MKVAIINNLAIHGATLTKDRFNSENKAYAFNGVDQYMTIPKFSTDTSVNSFSISLWAKSEQIRFGFLISLKSDSNFNCVNSIWIENGASQYNVHCNYASSFQPGNTCNATLLYKTITNSNDIWIHIVMTVEPPQAYFRHFQLYVNGEKVTSNTFQLSKSRFNYGGFIGTAVYNFDFYKGVLDDIRIYDKTLSENEVQELYHLQK